MTVYVDASCNWCVCCVLCSMIKYSSYILCMYVSVYIVGVCGGVYLYVSHFLHGNSFRFTTSYSLIDKALTYCHPVACNASISYSLLVVYLHSFAYT